MRLHPLLAAVTVVTTVAATACATSPLGRRQLMLVSQSQVTEMGVASYREMQTKLPATKDARTSNYVNCVARQITAEVGGNQAWEVTVFESKDVNAFALPGGKIGVYTGLLKAATTQDQLGAVIGHEIAHVLANHSAERLSDSMAAGLGAQVAGIATGVDPQLFEMAGNVFFVLPFSRAHESEADLLGLDLMAKAGFDPRQSIPLWQNMSRLGGNKPAEFMSTHPSDETRIRNLSERLNVAMPLYEQAQASGKRPQCSR